MNELLRMSVQYANDGRWPELIDLIDRNPALIREQDEFGRTLLFYCARFGGSSSVIRRLVELGADPNHRALDNSTALASAIVGGSRHGLTTIPELTALLEMGADPNVVADSGMPALHWAIAQHRPEHIQVLLEFGVDLNKMTSDSPPESAEDIARRIGSGDAMRLLEQYRVKGGRSSKT